MRVLHIIGSIDKSAGGPSRSVPQTCEQLADLGIEIELIARPSAHPVKPKLNQYFKLKFLDIKQLFKFGISISKNDYDLIHLQHIWDPYIHVMAWIAGFKGIPYIITPRGMLEPWIMQHNPLKKKIGMLLYQKKDLKKADVIHATCEMEKNNIQNLGIQNKIEVIPNGIDLSSIHEQKGSFGSKTIVFLSRIHKKKGIDILLEAWKKAKTKDWQLHIAGEGEPQYIQTLQNIIDAQGIQNARFVGGKYGDAKWDFIINADIFVLPTHSENFGIAIAEALAVGTPVITTTGTPWEELITHKCGWWIELSVENLTKAIESAINSDKEDLQAMSKNAIQLIKEKYDIQSVALKIKEMYSTIISELK